MEMEITRNDEQKLFVIPSGQGYSCLGYDVVYRHCLELSVRLAKFKDLQGSIQPVRSEDIGSQHQYAQYCRLVNLLATHDIGTYFDHDTPPTVRRILERYRKEGGRTRLFYGNTETGADWLEENDMIGRIGRSTGPMKIPLLVADGENGGPGLLDACIVRIMDVDTHREVWRHARYHTPEMRIVPTEGETLTMGYSHGVEVMGSKGQYETHANFKSYAKAAQWVAFMHGLCMTQPANL